MILFKILFLLIILPFALLYLPIGLYKEATARGVKETRNLTHIRFLCWLFPSYNDFWDQAEINEKEGIEFNKKPAEVEKRIEERRKLDRQIQKNDIAQFLEREGVKLPASDIDFQLRIGDVDLVKELCEEMYRDKRIGRTGNYRYFV